MTWTADQTPQSLIRQTLSPTEKASPPIEDPRLEPAFLVAYEGRLHIDVHGWRKKAKPFYTHATPKVLWLHVQRISLLAEMADPDIQGALVDLFIVLEGKGTPLCRHMLALAKPHLLDESYSELLNHLSAGASTSLIESNSAMLSSGIRGRAPLIRLDESIAHHVADPLETASQQIEFGQVELAQETLEKAIMVEPERAKLHKALIEIYQHSRNKEQILHMWRRLKGMPNPAIQEWHFLLDKLSKDQDKS
ncbi:MAG: hypothetical protein KZQ78_02980 [Candidatus Thiodiazotropha sp. (ex Ustalcina ferruginea)]|nr:hypothetical protein [Candidatus Thiodiazotropha sp. (ex Ustalcina ferruginea)]